MSFDPLYQPAIYAPAELLAPNHEAARDWRRQFLMVSESARRAGYSEDEALRAALADAAFNVRTDPSLSNRKRKIMAEYLQGRAA